MNDQEREMWVMNDESLYKTWKRSRLSKRNFIRENRVVIDTFINKVLNKNNTQTIRRYWE
jgi:hypothetical protein